MNSTVVLMCLVATTHIISAKANDIVVIMFHITQTYSFSQNVSKLMVAFMVIVIATYRIS